MRNAIYSTKTAVLDDALLASSCTCQAGSQGNNRGVCVHNLPLILLFVILLTNGLAQNILIELCNRWSVNIEETLSEEEIQKIKKALVILIAAHGSDHTSTGTVEMSYSIKQILEKFSVGTEKAKIFNPRPTDEELIPLRLISFKSNSKEAEEAIKKHKRRAGKGGVKRKNDKEKQQVFQSIPTSSTAQEDEQEEEEGGDKEEEGSSIKKAPKVVDGQIVTSSSCSSTPHAAQVVLGEDKLHHSDNHDTNSKNDNDEDDDVVMMTRMMIPRLRGGGHAGQGHRGQQDGDDSRRGGDHCLPKVLKKNGAGSLIPQICDFCDIRTSSHCCRTPLENGKCIIEGEGQRICGNFFCILCSVGEENRSCCPLHASSSSQQQEAQQQEKEKEGQRGRQQEEQEETNPCQEAHQTNDDSTSCCSHPPPTNHTNVQPQQLSSLTFIPNYLLVEKSIAALESKRVRDSIYHHASDEYYEEESCRLQIVPGYALLQIRARAQEEQEGQHMSTGNHSSTSNKDITTKKNKGCSRTTLGLIQKKQREKRDIINKWINAFKCQKQRCHPKARRLRRKHPHTGSTRSSCEKRRKEQCCTPTQQPVPPPGGATYCSQVTEQQESSSSSSSLSSTTIINKENQQPTKTKFRRSLPTHIQRNVENIITEKRKKNGRQRRTCSATCCFPGCNKTYKGANDTCTSSSTSFTRVPPPEMKPEPNHNTAALKTLDRYFKRKFHHELFMKAVGLVPYKDWQSSGLRICNGHHKIVKNKKHTITRSYKSGRAEKKTFTYLFEVPGSKGVRHVENLKLDKGSRSTTAKDRCHLKNMDNN